MSRSGQQVAQDNIAKFQSWIAERDAAGDGIRSRRSIAVMTIGTRFLVAAWAVI